MGPRSNTQFRPNVTQLGPISLQPSRGSPNPSAEHSRLRSSWCPHTRLKVFPFLPASIGPVVCFFYHARPAWFLLPQQHTNKHEALPVGFGRFGHYSDSAIMTRPYYSDSAMMVRPSHSDDSAILFGFGHDDSAIPFGIFGHYSDSAMAFRPPILIRPW